ncbi:DNA replication/repair protein RecF [Thiohalobacter sp. IOR34]|uniref:DNA replication/repair protein RecF n=1 Tax=Thiohalobacter sp. IOR34 TaxID=3057176 RepID=UPI0025B13AC6|nr:DNA replication/repair protein RecF [Thiohalobacter sp. IOR34]WJW75510.1 DNA replication/repair protein RecF [Thiohalobacter sp. IOR34]
MAVDSLSLRHFRNLEGAQLDFSPGFNLITGANGAGKTSLLEALFYLGRARSFRTRQAGQLIQAGQAAFLILGRLSQPDSGSLPVGIEYGRQGQRIRLGGRPLQQVAELVERLPLQLLNQDSHLLIEGGPRHRRRFLDWGVFHVEPGFYSLWRDYSRALRQRNAALRGRAVPGQVQVWDSALVEAAGRLDAMRRAYLERLRPHFQALLSELTEMKAIDLAYRAGWPERQAYAEALQAGLESDLRQGFTKFGPHRADLLLSIGGVPVQSRLSRGQQKQLIMALHLAQARLYVAERGRPCLFLVDDLPAELDAGHRERLLEQLRLQSAQVFVTAIEPQQIPRLDWVEPRRFHVEHGQVQEMVY